MRCGAPGGCGGGFYRRGGKEGSGSAGGQLSPAPGDEWCQREREKATGFTRELCTDADEHMSKEERDEHSARALCRWPDRARARCGELRHRRAAGWSYGGGDEDGGEGWHALAGRAASTRSTEALATRRARVWHASTLGRTRSPRGP